MLQTVDTWAGCYPSNWKGIITPDAFRHPAKFSSRLIERIYAHALEEGWLKPGDKVCDPFGGVGLGAYPAMRYGLDWTGCELEESFVDLGRANIDLWNRRYQGRLNQWGTARLLHGDSRNLSAVIQTANGCISSPPFMQTSGGTNCTAKDGPLSNPALLERHAAGNAAAGYGITAGQLGAMRDGDYLAAISSPPYADSMEKAGGIDPSKSNFVGGPNSQMHRSDTRYGSTSGQLGAMPDAGIQAAISSPPFEDSLSDGLTQADRDKYEPFSRASASVGVGYGTTPGNTGNMSGETFWTAARQIIEQVYQVLAPGGHAIFVVKGYIKNKTYVDFPGQWRQVCEAAGFEAIHEHHAMLVRHTGTSITLEGQDVEHITSTKSFFRRLAEAKGSPPINFETVLCMVKR